MSGNWNTFQYGNLEGQPKTSNGVAEQYTAIQARSIIKTLYTIHTAFDIIVENARTEAGVAEGRAGLSLIFNLNLQKFITQNREKHPEMLLHTLLFPGVGVDYQTEYPIGLVGFCNIAGRQQLCQIISPFDTLREANVTACQGNNQFGADKKAKAKTLTKDPNPWLRGNGEGKSKFNWADIKLSDIGADTLLRVQILTKNKASKGEREYTVMGGEISISLDENYDGNDPDILQGTDFRLIPTAEKVGLSNDFDNMNPGDFVAAQEVNMDTESRVLNDTLSRNAEGNYKPHGGLVRQNKFATDQQDSGRDALAVATPAIGDDLYCVLCKKGIGLKDTTKASAWKNQKYEVDHIFNLIFNTYCNLNGSAGGFFDTCSKCNQIFKGEKLWCPNYDVWDALLNKMLEGYNDKPTIAELRTKFPWPGLKCQGMSEKGGNVKMPYGGWRTFITGWTNNVSGIEQETAVLKQLKEHYPKSSVNLAEFAKAQSLRYSEGSKRPDIKQKNNAGFLSTFVLQDCFLRRVLYVVETTRDDTEDGEGQRMLNFVQMDSVKAAIEIAGTFAKTTLDMMATWKGLNFRDDVRKSAASVKAKIMLKEYNSPFASPRKLQTLRTPPPIRSPKLPSSQGTTDYMNNLDAKGVSASTRRALSHGYVLTKDTELINDSLQTLSQGENIPLGDKIKTLERIINVIRGEKNKKEKIISSLEEELGTKVGSTGENDRELVNVKIELKEFKGLCKKAQAELSVLYKQRQTESENFLASDMDEEESDDPMHISEEEEDDVQEQIDYNSFTGKKKKPFTRKREREEQDQPDIIWSEIIRVYKERGTDDGLKYDAILARLLNRPKKIPVINYNDKGVATLVKVILESRSNAGELDATGNMLNPTYKYNRVAKRRKPQSTKGGKRTKRKKKRKKKTKRKRKYLKKTKGRKRRKKRRTRRK